MKTPNAEQLLNRAMTLLALAPSYAAARSRRDRLEDLWERGEHLAQMRAATELYEELVAKWLARLDTVRGVHEGSPLLASWGGSVEPLLSLLPDEARENPTRPRGRTKKRRKARRGRP